MAGTGVEGAKADCQGRRRRWARSPATWWAPPSCPPAPAPGGPRRSHRPGPEQLPWEWGLCSLRAGRSHRVPSSELAEKSLPLWRSGSWEDGPLRKPRTLQMTQEPSSRRPAPAWDSRASSRAGGQEPRRGPPPGSAPVHAGAVQAGQGGATSGALDVPKERGTLDLVLLEACSGDALPRPVCGASSKQTPTFAVGDAQER